MKHLRGSLIVIAAILFFSCRQHTPAPAAAERPAGDSLLNRNPYVNIDQSPMDMSWCPANFPVEKMKGNDSLKLIARIIYSRPHKKGRPIFGDSDASLCPYGKPWRLGANEATEVNLFENVSVDGKNIIKGTYVLYCIPHADHWTIILNNNLYTWGLHINSDKDLFKVDLPVQPQSPALEDFTITFKDTDTGADMVMAWDNVKTELPVVFVK